MKVLTSAQTRSVEQNAFASGITSERLMENAGAAATRVIRKNFNIKESNVVILTGQGNNGGDGFVVARKLKEYGARVSVVTAAGITVTSDCTKMLQRAKNSQITMVYFYDNTDFAKELINSADIIVDAIFGIGFHGIIEKDIAEIIKIANSSDATRVALDLPSGVLCDTGKVMGVAFKADLTISFIGYKPCHFLFPGCEYCGKVSAVSIGYDDITDDKVFVEVISKKEALNMLSDIPVNAHKGTKGTAVIVAGSYGMSGAAVISARAAMRSGAGLVSLAISEKIYSFIASEIPEVIFNPLKDKNGFLCADSYTDAIFDKANSLLIGPGLGNNCDTEAFVNKILSNVKVPLVIDADALNIVAKNVDILKRISAPVIVTPHSGEMARLLGKTVDEVEEKRIDTAVDFANEYGVITVLKGAYTVIAEPYGKVYINTTGNECMATAGSGDMLSGMMAAFLANKTSPIFAAVSAVCLHGAAGDLSAEKYGTRGVIVTDIIKELPNIFKERFALKHL